MAFDLTPQAGGRFALWQLPWPNDLYRDASGHLAVAAIPELQGSNYESALLDGLSDLDGFGVTTAAFLRFDQDLDATTVTASTTFLVQLDGDGRGTRVPLQFHFDSDSHTLAALPGPGFPLYEHTRYALVLTTDVHGAGGKAALRPSELGRALLGQGPAAATYAPLAQWLSEQHLSAGKIAGATVFTTQSVTSDLVQARAIVWSGAAPRAHLVRLLPDAQMTLDRLLGVPAAQRPGLDNPAATSTSTMIGIAHDAIGRVVYGSIDVPRFNSDTDGVGGKFQLDAQGHLVQKGTTTVPFTLVLPQNPSGQLPVVVFTHSIEVSRAQVFGIANTLAGAGFAVLAADLPFHGSRNPLGHDDQNNLTGAIGPDGVGDDAGLVVASMFFGITANGDLLGLHPALVRDNLRQAVAEQIALARLLAQGDWSEIRAADPMLSQLAFDGGNVYSVAEGLGSFVAQEAVTLEPTFRAAVLSIAGGGLLFPTLLNSPDFSPTFTPILFSELNLSATNIDWANFHPMYQPLTNLFQTVTDRADPLAYAPYAVQRPLASVGHAQNLLLTEALGDEAVPNHSTEPLARALGLESVPVGGRTPVLRFAPGMASAPAPLTGNASGATAAFVQFDPSPGALLLKQRGVHEFQPDFPPFVKLQTPVMLDNPIERTHLLMLHFLTSTRDTGAATVIDPFL
ncbi:MAG TPA: hypothetical protein VKN99_17440 [Polyangia bacterium]|nr:hypothetical protein [Polyangia bacterium]